MTNASPVPSPRQKSRKPPSSRPAVRDIGLEVVERPLLAICARKNDPHPWRRVPTAACAGAVRNHAARLQPDETDFRNRLARAGQKNGDQRQRPAERAGTKLRPHVDRLEEAETEDRAERVPQPAERSAVAVRHLGDRPDRLQPRQHIGLRLRKEGVRIEEIGSAEHIVQHRPVGAEIVPGPGTHPRQLLSIEPSPRAVERVRVLLPAAVAGPGRKSAVVRRRQSREKARGIVRRRFLGIRGTPK